VFHNEEEAIFSLNYFVELNDVRMAHNSKYMYLSRYALNIVHIIDLPFVENLDGHLLPCKNVVTLFHFTKCALSERLFYFVVTNETIAHVYYFFMLLTFERYLDFCVVDAILKLY
jgi:hypothetical protein